MKNNIFKTAIGLWEGRYLTCSGGPHCWVFCLHCDYRLLQGSGRHKGRLSAQSDFVGFLRKYAFYCNCGGYLVDTVLGQGSFFRDAAVFFYIATNISVTENIGE